MGHSPSWGHPLDSWAGSHHCSASHRQSQSSSSRPRPRPLVLSRPQVHPPTPGSLAACSYEPVLRKWSPSQVGMWIYRDPRPFPRTGPCARLAHSCTSAWHRAWHTAGISTLVQRQHGLSCVATCGSCPQTHCAEGPGPAAPATCPEPRTACCALVVSHKVSPTSLLLGSRVEAPAPLGCQTGGRN